MTSNSNASLLHAAPLVTCNTVIYWSAVINESDLLLVKKGRGYSYA